MELHARARRDLEPDPEFDPICALFYCLSSDAPLSDVDGSQMTGAIVVDKDHQTCDLGSNSFHHSPAEMSWGFLYNVNQSRVSKLSSSQSDKIC